MRRKTTVVKIGNIVMSSEHPVVVQSMLNTLTMDTDACVEQSVRIIEAGGQLVRITAQGVKEAENLKNIRAKLTARGFDTPLSADIHFTPDAALVAACYVEKVRINPGNFVDKRAIFKSLTYTDVEYAEELKRLRETFTEFLDVCRQHNTAVRIGTNHGSLSDRIMSRYGNTPAGMVEATMEYLRICKETNFTNVVISLKSSDCKVMVDAVRLLVCRMEEEGMDFPLHLGVTEAGEGEDGRIRSAVGIGTLLNEGIGDTIRVSLTEAPENEIPVAKSLLQICSPDYRGAVVLVDGECVKPVVVGDISSFDVIDETVSSRLGFRVGAPNDPVYGAMLHAGDKTPEMIYTEALGPELTKLPSEVTVIVPWENIDMAHVYNRGACPLFTVPGFVEMHREKSDTRYRFVKVDALEDITPEFIDCLKIAEDAILVLAPGLKHLNFRNMIQRFREAGLTNKVILKADINATDKELASLSVAAHTGGFFLDRQAYGIWIYSGTQEVDNALELSRNILQSSGLRRYKTEFVSCPGCGRTLYNLEEAVARVKQAFSHLNTLKIAIMGCVVNGPGEMGDADYGYVGAGNGKVNLYKGRRMVRSAVPEQEAIAALKQLITEHGDWKEPE